MFQRVKKKAKLDIALPRVTQTFISSGYGFVTMGSYENAVRAIQQLNGYLIDGKQIAVLFSTGPPPSVGTQM